MKSEIEIEKKVVLENRYEDIKDEIQKLRSRFKTNGKIIVFLITIKDAVIRLFSFEENWFHNIKEDFEMRIDLDYISTELDLLKRVIKEISKKNTDEKLKKNDLEYYGFDQEKIKRISNKHINFLEDIINKYKDKFEVLPEVLKEAIRERGYIKRLSELIEGLE